MACNFSVWLRNRYLIDQISIQGVTAAMIIAIVHSDESKSKRFDKTDYNVISSYITMHYNTPEQVLRTNVTV